MLDLKKDFPIFANNPGLIFMDSGASAQKPQYVIDWVNQFVSHDYANIHRWNYSLSERSDDLYFESKEKVAKHLNCKDDEVIYSYNATYAINLLADSLAKSGFFQPWAKIMLGIRDHHANIVPRQQIAKQHNISIERIHIKDDYSIDWDDFMDKYDDKVKLVACWHVSNVTGQIYDIRNLKSKLRKHTFLCVDWSQSFPHFAIDVESLGCDAFVFTGHKVLAYTGIGVLFLKNKWVKQLEPSFSGGGAIQKVTTDGFTYPSNLSKFEAGTPHIIGAVSLLRALEYIEGIGGFDAIQQHEQQLVEVVLRELSQLSHIKLLGSYNDQNRIATFSFYLPEQSNHNRIWEYFAEQDICIRTGWHCAHPLHLQQKISWTCRASLYIYNSIKDIKIFVQKLKTYKIN